MAEIIRTLIDPYKTTPCLDGIVDVEEADGAWRITSLRPTKDVWVAGCPNNIALDSTFCDQALIRYELWDGEPATSGWDESWSRSVHLTSGKVFTVSSHSGEISHHEEFDLGRRDHEWRFRVHRTFLSHEDFTTDIIGLVLFKVRFWSSPQGVQPSENEPVA
ncbi:hypothetical protein ACWDR1_06835 [Streptosporangium sandarakinum]